jgi:aminomethyltransferase
MRCQLFLLSSSQPIPYVKVRAIIIDDLGDRFMAKLPLHDEHVKLGAKIVFYGGFTMPQEYKGLVAEHRAVRQSAGLFDVSHMGRIMIEGDDALTFVDGLVTNQILNQPPNKAIYALMCQEDGYPIDDLIAYVLSPKKILLVVNAINTPTVMNWLHERQGQNLVAIENRTSAYLQLALQGPLSEIVLQEHITKKVELSQLKFMTYLTTKHQGGDLLISRSGYTGSDGFELYADLPTIHLLWQTLIADPRVSPCGLGARDTLRFEAALPLYSHEISETISPIEAGLNFAVKFNKAFIGKAALEKQVTQGVSKKLVGIELLGRGVARAEYPILVEGKEVGHITTGYILPDSTKALAMALIDSAHAALGTQVTVMMRATPIPAVVRDMIFMQKQYKR